MGKFIPKLRSFEDEYTSPKDLNRNKKQKKEAAELRRLRQRQYEDDGYGYVDKRYSKL